MHQPGGHHQDAAAQGGGGDVVPAGVDGTGGPAGEVVGPPDQGQPGGVGGEPARGQVRQSGVVFEVGDDVLNNRVRAVVGLDLEEVTGASVMNAWESNTTSSASCEPDVGRMRRTTSRQVTEVLLLVKAV